METRNIFGEITRAPDVYREAYEKREIVTYEPAKAIAWTKLVKDRHVRIVSFQGKTGWSDGFMLEVAEVPERLSKLKDFIESRRDDPIDADKLLPELYPDAVVVEPLCTALARDKGWPDVVYLSNLRRKRGDERLREVWIDKRYVDYFWKQYKFPAPWLKFLLIGPTQPVVVEQQQEIVGMIMPIATEESVRIQCREFLQPHEPPYAPPPIEPPVDTPDKSRFEAIKAMDYDHTLEELKRMARDRGLSPSGTKHEIIDRLLRYTATNGG